MRISIVSETYFPQVNGVSRTLDRLVGHLAERGDRVQLIIPRYESPERVPDVVVLDERRAVRLPFYQEIRLPLATPAGVLAGLAAFCPDLVHIATEGPLGWSALKAAKRGAVPVVSSYHTTFPS